MTINDKSRDEKLQDDNKREVTKISALPSGKIDKYGFLTGEEIVPADQTRIIEQARFTYFALGKASEMQKKAITEQGKREVEASEVLKPEESKNI